MYRKLCKQLCGGTKLPTELEDYWVPLALPTNVFTVAKYMKKLIRMWSLWGMQFIWKIHIKFHLVPHTQHGEFSLQISVS